MPDARLGEQAPTSAGSAAPPTSPPPGLDAQALQEKVHWGLSQGAYVSAISAPAPHTADLAIPMAGTTDARLIAGFQTYVWAHRLRVQDYPPENGRGLRATNAAGKLHFDLAQRLVVVPHGYDLPLSKGVPPTPLDLGKSQSIALTDAEFRFDGQGENRFLGSAVGRTYPDAAGKSARFGANGEITQGFGIFAGVVGSYVINGVLGPDGPRFQVLIRFQDSDGKLETRSDLSALAQIPDSDPGSTYMTILGREDPQQPVQQKIEDGKLVGGHVTELFSLVWLDFDDGRRGKGLRTTRRTGQLVGKLETDINFAPTMPPTSAPTPFTTANTKITFRDSCGAVVGTIHPNIEVGQGYLMPLPGFSVPVPSFRIVGFGPIDGGTGQFAGAKGMLAVNSIISVAPAALYNMYVLRFDDPEHRLRLVGLGGQESKPARQDPESTMRKEAEWQRILNQGACFNTVALPDPERPNTPIPFPDDPEKLAGVEVRGVGHRFQIEMAEPTIARGLRARNIVGERALDFSLRWLVIPEDFGAAPGRQPPPTALDMSKSQRFALMNAEFDFGNGNRILTIGAGQTFPLPGNQQATIRIAALGAVLEGFGKFRGLPGNYFLSGHFTPPENFNWNIFLRIQDTNGELLAKAVPPIRRKAILPVGVTYLIVRAANPPPMTQLFFGPSGIPEGIVTLQDLTQFSCDFSVDGGTPRACRTIGARYGVHRVALSGAVMPTPTVPGTPSSPLPFSDKEEFYFYDLRGAAIGSLVANVIEGRTIMTSIDGIPSQAGPQIVGGFAPIDSGTGPFAGMTGILLNVGAGIVQPDLLDLPYIVVANDPDGKLRAD